MEVAYLTSKYPATSHTFIRREVTALRRRGVSVATFSVRAPAPEEISADDRAEAASTFTILRQSPAAFARAHLVSLVRTPVRYLCTALLALRHRPPGLRGLLLSAAYFAEAGVLGWELRRRSIRHLHTHFANAGATVGLLASRLAGISWSFVMHGPSETDYPAGYLLPEKVRSADMVVCVSWFAHSQAMRLVSPSHWQKFRLVHCGLSLQSLPSNGNRDTQSKTIVCVGRLCSDKAQAGLIEAFDKVYRQFPEARLRFIGDGADRPDLEQMVERLGLRDFVTFTGRLGETDTLREISQAGVMALPSFWEGLPVVLMEAMALEVPVVTSRIAGVPELVTDTVNGLLFTPARWGELADCIIRLFEEPELALRLAKAGRSTIEREFDVDESARRLEQHFAALLSPTAAASRSAELQFAAAGE